MNIINELQGDKDRLHQGLAGFVLIFSLIIYTITKAPTLSFWDCGEFVTCSYILGIPHPPGTPFYIILGRLFSMLPLVSDIAARVNMLSAVTGGFAAFFAYLVTFRIIRMWWTKGDFTGWKRVSAYIGAFVGSMMFAFGRTHWNNSVEAEVYTPAMLVMMIVIWLLLRWIEKRHLASSDKLLYLITYLAFLSIGIHLTTFLIMPAVFLAIILFSKRLRKDIRFYITGCCLFLVAHNFELFAIATGLWLIICLVALLIKRERIWRLCFGMVLLTVLGFSCQLYTPIRSAQHPAINQNNPSSSYKAFNNFLERRQYGQESMFKRALTRRAELANQFGNFKRIGLWRFFSHQYGINGRSFAFIFVLGLLGLYEIIRRQPKFGWPFLIMILLGTVVLVWYMNFADGTRQNPVTGNGHIEVRDRDYFFTPGFVLFGIAIGIGVAALIDMARTSIMNKMAGLKTPIMIFVCALVLLSAAPIMANYHISDRTGNYIPYDFAKNYLDSCDPNSVLFIGGDNDTFPIWCLQNVYKYRTDVTVVNLALSNLDWYIIQIRDEMKVPLRWTDGQIRGLRNKMYPSGKKIRIQDQVLDEILNVNNWKRPVHFAITIPHDMRQYNGRSIQANMIMQGMVYRVEPGQIKGKIDMEKGYNLFFSKFSYRSLADKSVYKDERTLALTGNYTTGLQLMADSMRKVGRYDDAIMMAKKAIEVVPYEYSSYNYLATLYVETGQEFRIETILEQLPESQHKDVYFVWGMAYRYIGNLDKAAERMKITLEKYPHFNDAFREYSRLLYDSGKFNELRSLIQAWIANNKDDTEAPQMLDALNKSHPAQKQDS